MMDRKYKFLLWDVDGTLLDFPYSQKIAITACLETIGVEVTEEMVERYAEINDSWWKRLELGEVTKAQLLPGRFQDLFAEFRIACPDADAFRMQYQELLGGVYKYIENSLELCEWLQGKYRQFVVTNGVAHTQLNKLRLSGFTEFMEDIFISEQVGAPKPRKEFFDVCFERISELHPDFDKNTVLIIGDSLSSDMKGGRNAGIDTCWYNPEGLENETEIVVTYEIKSLKEIPGLLGEEPWQRETTKN